METNAAHAADPLDSELDDELIDAVLAGDRTAYDQLVLRYQDRLFGSLTHITGSPDDAQEVAQEAFVQAYLKLAGFHRKAAFYTWLYRIAFNLAVSRGRKKRERTSLDGLREEAGLDPQAEQPAVEAEMESQERTALVHQALSQLGDEYRQVMVLRELEGFDYQKIAEVVDIPVGTVRSRLFRARLQLKELLAPLLLET